MASVKFSSSILELAKVQLRDAFLHAQPALSRAIKSMFIRKFGESDWLSNFKSYLGPSMQAFAVDDGRPFDM